MIVQDKSQLDVIETSNVSESINGIISAKAMGKVIEMISNNAYAYPIPSIMREITSNGFDAHIKADTFENVIINIVENNYDDMYVEFIDKGTGMSPNTIKDIYMNWGESDKSDSNLFIGGWGLGSKSPFSYTNFFEISTVSDNIEYNYYFHNQDRDEYGNKKFTLDLISDVPTDKRNGTTIKITIKNYIDLAEYLKTIRKQLSYFNNLTVNINIVNQEIKRINCDLQGLNDFNFEKIIEYKTFKYRLPFGDIYTYNSSAQRISEDNKNNGMFILIDSVAYPINTNEFNEINGFITYISLFYVGLKFSIGELEVTINREAINYTKKTKDKIIERFNEFKKEINTIYLSQHNETEFNYKKFIVNERKNIRLGTTTDFISIKVSEYFYEHNKFTKKYAYLPDSKLFVPSFKSIAIMYADLGYLIEDTLITTDNDSGYSTYNSLISNSSQYSDIENMCKITKFISVVDKKSEISKVKNFYCRPNSLIFKRLTYEERRKKFMSYCYDNQCSFIEKRKEKDITSFYIHSEIISSAKSLSYYRELDNDLINPYNYYYNDVKTEYKNRQIKHKVRRVPVLGKAIEMIKMINHFKKFFADIQNYSDIEVTPEMQEDYIEYIREKNPQYKRKKEEKIIIYDGYRYEISIDDLLKRADKIIILIKEQKKDKYKRNNKYNDKTFITKLFDIIKDNQSSDKYKPTSYSMIEMSDTAYKVLVRGIKKRIALRKLTENPLMTIDEFYNIKYIKNLIIRCCFYKIATRNNILFDSEEDVITNTNAYVKELRKIAYYDYSHYLIKKYFSKVNYSYNIYDFISLCSTYFNITEKDFNSIYKLYRLKNYIDEYNVIIKNTVVRNPILKYLSGSTPALIANKLIKGLKKMDYFYIKPVIVTLSDKAELEETLVSLF